MLSEAQAAVFTANVAADPVLSLLTHTLDNADLIAKAYQELATPVFVIWKSNVIQDEIMQNGFDWTQVDELTGGKARIWEWMFSNEGRSINPSKINVRAGIDNAWKGTAAMLAVRAAVYVHCRRSANRLEKLFAVGTGTDASPATMAIEGQLTYMDVKYALGW